MSAYALEFTLPGLPRTTNSMASAHWRTRHGHAKRWKRAVLTACLGRIPPTPLAHAVLTLVRCSAKEPDYDGLVSSFKHVIDGLIEAGVIAGDKMSVIGRPNYCWEPAPMKRGHVKVKVQSLTEENK